MQSSQLPIQTTMFLKYEPFIVTTSCLTPALKKSVKSVLHQLGGHVVQEWTKDCSMVVMSNLSVTIKVMCALISCANVVTPEYLARYLEATKNGEAKPDPSDFLPPLAESQITQDEVSFSADPSRQNLFQGKMFIFLTSKQFKKLNLSIELGGGVPFLMEEGTDDNDDSVLIAPGTCVMECSPSENSQQLSQNAQEWISHVLDYLQKNKKRPIPEAELGFAALYSSTEKYCNPDCVIGGPHLGAIPGQTLSQQVDPDISQSMAYRSQQSQDIDSKHQARPSRDVKPSASVKPELIRVKEEPVSQIFAAEESIHEREIATASKRKRGRDDEEEAQEPNRKQVKVERRSRSKSTSPGPTTKRELRSTSPAKRNIDDNDNKIDFDSVPPRRGRKESQRKRSPGPTNALGDNEANEFSAFTGQERNSRQRSPVFEAAGEFGVSQRLGGQTKGEGSPEPEHGDNEFDSVPARSRPGRNARKKSPAPVDMDKGNEFDSVPARSGQGRNLRKRSPTPVGNDETSELDSVPARTGVQRGRKRDKLPTAGDLFSGAKTSDVVLASDSDDGTGMAFDSVPPRKARQQKRKTPSRSPSPGEGHNVSDFDQLPARKGGRSKHPVTEKPDGNGVDQNREKSFKREVTNAAYISETVTEDTDFDDLKHVAADFDLGKGPGVAVIAESDNIDAAPPRKSHASVKQEPAVSPPAPVPEGGVRMKQDIKPSTSRKVSPRRSNLNTAPEEGFLTTTRPNENFIKTEENQFDPDVPAACAKINYTSLVVRRQKPTKSGSTMPPAWKGMPVKNFKRFKKVLHKGSDDLPRVIGGRDLVPHASLAKRQVMEKFAADLQMTQHEEEEDDCQDLFNAVSVPERRGRGRKR
ncbi:nibrin-like isoform X2 [Lineus longissimus]|uniref:nibrin-like isoform X2 n=1 Tax=Lineus longissimus TaxID=88925 RepID=UPI00315DA56B